MVLEIPYLVQNVYVVIRIVVVVSQGIDSCLYYKTSTVVLTMAIVDREQGPGLARYSE